VINFARHGQTELNREGRLQGRIDVPLSELGAQQAAALARGYASAPVTRVLSSPLQRARATAAAIAAPHGLTVEVDDRLIELDYGAWDGLALADVSADDWASWRSDVDFAPPGGERLCDVGERIASFCAEVLTGDLVVAVSHVSPIKAAVCGALRVDERASWRMQLDVASVTRIGRRPDGSSYLISFNDASLVNSPGKLT
jgi:broad specificity phosphatase PhoE